MTTTEKILVIDVETTNTIDDALIYDIGFLVCDLSGNIYEKHSYTIAEIFLDQDLMASAYFFEKIPQYWSDIKNGTRKLHRLNTVRHIIYDVVNQYHITKLFAYNIRFDYNALLTTTRYLSASKYRYYLPYQLEIHDILKLSRTVLNADDDYTRYCQSNGYITKYGANRHTAEIVARYLFDNNFIECHTGCEDCEIEHKILCTLYTDECDTKLW